MTRWALWSALSNFGAANSTRWNGRFVELNVPLCNFHYVKEIQAIAKLQIGRGLEKYRSSIDHRYQRHLLLQNCNMALNSAIF